MEKIVLYSLALWYGLKSKLTYRLSSIFELVGKFIEFFAQILIWVALLGNGSRFDTNLTQMVTYLILTRMVTTLLNSTAGNVITRGVRDGSIGNEFVRPLNLKVYLFASDLGSNVFKVLVIFLPLSIVAALMYGFVFPPSLLHGVCFAVSLLLGGFMMFHYSYLLGLVSFWLFRNPFYKWHFRNVEQIFSGQFFPLWLYPVWLSIITEYLPFRYFTYEPLAIYLGKTPVEEIPFVIGLQVLWAVTLYVAERIVWTKAQRKVIVQGG